VRRKDRETLLISLLLNSRVGSLTRISESGVAASPSKGTWSCSTTGVLSSFKMLGDAFSRGRSCLQRIIEVAREEGGSPGVSG
jgi:hypothetical protein